MKAFHSNGNFNELYLRWRDACIHMENISHHLHLQGKIYGDIFKEYYNELSEESVHV